MPKGKLTQCGKSLAELIEVESPEQEVRYALSKLLLPFDNLVAKHENYSRLIAGDSEFEVQEGWTTDCKEDFISMEVGAKIYLYSFLSQREAPSENCETENNGVAGPGSNGIPGMQIEDDAPIVSSGDDYPINSPSSGNNDVTLKHKSTSFVCLFFFLMKYTIASKTTPMLHQVHVVLRWKSRRCLDLPKT